VTNTRARSSQRAQSVEALAQTSGVPAFIAELTALSIKALPAMYLESEQTFVQTVRRDSGRSDGLRKEGVNLRYAAIVALGLAAIDEKDQQSVLNGLTAADLARRTAQLVTERRYAADLGAAALAAWAVGEVCNEVAEQALSRVLGEIDAATPQPTVDYSWALTALLAVRHLGDFDDASERAARRLIDSQGGKGIFGHHLPPEALGRYRAHVSCFADQVYPIQALARYSAASGQLAGLAAANRCAQRIVELQGDAGQWWWHYDARTGDIVEGYPVYSVHQHAMAPMALFDLIDCGGDDHRAAIADGLSWLTVHPESDSELLDPTTGAIWRKIGRKEPRKALRSIRAVTTSMSPGFRLGFLDKVFRPGVVDYECRPYEIGWLLYAWLSSGVGRRQAAEPTDAAADIGRP
jgi:hypothetical protein